MSVYAKFTENTTSHAHSYTATVTEPTYIEEGYTTYTCTCGHSYEDTKTSALGNSSPDDGEGSVTAPTYEEQGHTTYICPRCQ